MNDIHIIKASLDLTQDICDLFRQRIDVWQRINTKGYVETLPYDSLTIYERWLHGGPWMSVETAAIHLNHHICSGGLAWVAIADGFILGYVEAYPGVEPAPYGKHLHIAEVVAHFESEDEIKDLLLRHIIEMATEHKYERVTVSFSGYDMATAAQYRRYGMSQIAQIRRYTLPAKTGQGFYKVSEHPNANPDQLKGWHMSAGRIQSSHQHWEALWPDIWQSIDELAARQIYRLRFNIAGHDALVCVEQELYNPRSVNIACWSAKPLNSQFMTALRDWTHRENYRTLVLNIPESEVKALGPDAEPDPFRQDIYAVNVK